ncbi:MAG: GNAT family N-acetyltransferase [Xanthomonadales bacterium]|nr:GNAT family N-acetyltransferase [Xanthomonadales bacterium]
MDVRTVANTDAEAVVSTLAEAFYHYPVMRYVLADEVADFDTAFEELIRLFVMSRVICDDLLLGIGEGPQLRAAAAVSLPRGSDPPAELAEYRQVVWSRFPPAAKQRYDDFCAACARFDIPQVHHHLNMIGTRTAHQGEGLGRRLIEHVQALAADHPYSTGVSLSTENPANVPFYQNLGFELTGHAAVGPGLETWNFFRPNP